MPDHGGTPAPWSESEIDALVEFVAGQDAVVGGGAAWLLPDYRLFADRDGGLLLTQRIANLIGRAAAHTSLPPPPAATSARSDRGPDGPFAADFTRHTSLTAAEPNQTVLTGRRTLVTAFRRGPPTYSSAPRVATSH